MKSGLLYLIACIERTDKVDLIFNIHIWLKIVRPKLEFKLECLVKFEERSQAVESGTEDNFELVNGLWWCIYTLHNPFVICFNPLRFLFLYGYLT